MTDHVSWRELWMATLATALVTALLVRWRGLICWIAVLVVSGIMARICRARIGGVTGDTLGASTELCETAVLLVPLAMGV